MRCPSCKMRLFWRARFCTECGNRIPPRMLLLHKSQTLVQISALLLAALAILVFILSPALRDNISKDVNTMEASISESALNALDPPSAILDNFCSNITFKSYPNAYNLYSNDLRQRVSFQQFETIWADEHAAFYQLNSCTHSNVSFEQNHGRSTLFIRKATATHQIPYTVTLIQQKDGWKIDHLTSQ